VIVARIAEVDQPLNPQFAELDVYRRKH
jgi:hypothetical protein